MLDFLRDYPYNFRNFEKNITKYCKTPNASVNQIITHIFEAQGKKIRPLVFTLISDLIEYKDEEFRDSISAVCEYIHTASLLHDDVIDNSKLRRNQKTVNSIWGDETAILSGDLIYSTACRLMVKTQNLDLIDAFAECIRYMSESELFQLECLRKLSTLERDYFQIIDGKTACLLGASAKSPGILKKIPKEDILLLEDFGKNLGFAFQIKDDCLDYEGSLEKLGKPVLSDLIEGKLTLPVILCLQSKDKQLSSDLKKRVKAIFERGSAKDEDYTQILSLLSKDGALEKALEYSLDYIDKAKSALYRIYKKYSKSHDHDKAYEALLKLCDFIIRREK